MWEYMMVHNPSKDLVVLNAGKGGWDNCANSYGLDRSAIPYSTSKTAGKYITYGTYSL